MTDILHFRVNLPFFIDLAVIFRPGLINHPTHELNPKEHSLSQQVLEFLIEHQDWFMLDVVPPPPTASSPTSPGRSENSPPTSAGAGFGAGRQPLRPIADEEYRRGANRIAQEEREERERQREAKEGAGIGRSESPHPTVISTGDFGWRLVEKSGGSSSGHGHGQYSSSPSSYQPQNSSTMATAAVNPSPQSSQQQVGGQTPKKKTGRRRSSSASGAGNDALVTTSDGSSHGHGYSGHGRIASADADVGRDRGAKVRNGKVGGKEKNGIGKGNPPPSAMIGAMGAVSVTRSRTLPAARRNEVIGEKRGVSSSKEDVSTRKETSKDGGQRNVLKKAKRSSVQPMGRV